jgi:ankyrin repeat protein
MLKSRRSKVVVTNLTKITTEELEEIIIQIKDNKIQELDLSSYEIDDIQAEKIAAALQSGYSLTSLNFEMNNLDFKIKKAIKNYLQRNEEAEKKMRKALDEDNIAQIIKYIKQGANPNQLRADHSSLIHIAIEENNLELLDAAIKAGADIEKAKDFKRETPLYIAASKGKIKIVEALIAAKADLTPPKTYEHQTPLSIALNNNHIELARILETAIENTLKAKPANELNNMGAQRSSSDILKPLDPALIKNSELQTPLLFLPTETIKITATLKEDVNKINSDNKTIFSPLFQKNSVFSKPSTIILHPDSSSSSSSSVLPSLSKSKLTDRIKTIIGLKKLTSEELQEIILKIQDRRTFELDLSAKEINIEQVIEIANVLKNSYSVSSINFGKNKLDPQIKKKIEEYLSRNQDKEEEMLKALNESDIKKAMQLIKEGANINKATIHYGNLLYIAASIGELEAVKYLIEVGEDVNKQELDGLTAIHIAVKMSYFEIVKTLIKAGADINKETSLDQKTPLHYAVENNLFKLVVLLTEAKADLNKATRNKETVFEIALKNNYLGIVNILIKAGAKFDQKTTNKGNSLLFIGVVNNDLTLVNSLIKLGADINQANEEGENKGFTPLYVAVQNGYANIAEALIKAGADLDKEFTFQNKKVKVLEIAIELQDQEIINLLNQAARQKIRDSLPSLWSRSKTASYAGIDSSQSLPSQASEPLSSTSTLSKAGSQDLTLASPSFVITHIPTTIGANFKQETTNKEDLALYVAVINNDLSLVNILIQAGEDPNQTNKEGINKGLTPLFAAVQNGYNEIIKTLIKAGGNINIKVVYNNKIYSLLEIAEFHKKKETVDLLKAELKKISKLALEEIIASIKANEIHQLDLSKKEIDDSQAEEILNALQVGYSLTSIKFSNNTPSPKIKKTIECLLTRNQDNKKTRDEEKVKKSEKTPTYTSTSSDVKEVNILAKVGQPDQKALDKKAIPLCAAVKDRELEKVKILLKLGEDINQATMEEGETPLFIAAERNYLQIAQFLINAGADVNKATQYYKATPLYIAAQNGYVEMVKLLIAAKADINIKFTHANGKQYTPLTIARSKKHQETVDILEEAIKLIPESSLSSKTKIFRSSASKQPTPISSSSTDLNESTTLALSQQLPIPVINSSNIVSTNSAPISNSIQLYEADICFLTYLRHEAQSSGGIVVGTEISDLYLKEEGKNSLTRQVVVAQRKKILNDPDRSSLYNQLQSQLNSIIRAMQQANITFTNNKNFTGKDFTQKILTLLTPIIAKTPLIGNEINLIVANLYDFYKEEKLKERCARLSNLQGDGEKDIRLLSEALARKITLDKELLRQIASLIITTEKNKSEANIFKKAIIKAKEQTPNLEERIAHNRLSAITKETYLITTLLLTAIFEDERFIQRVEVNNLLVESIYHKLQENLGLNLKLEPELKNNTSSSSQLKLKTYSNITKQVSASTTNNHTDLTATKIVTSTLPKISSPSPSFDNDKMLKSMQEMQKQIEKQQKRQMEQEEKQKQHEEEIRRLRAEKETLEQQTKALANETSQLKKNLPCSQPDSTISLGSQAFLQAKLQSQSSQQSNPFIPDHLSQVQKLSEHDQRLGAIEQIIRELQEDQGELPSSSFMVRKQTSKEGYEEQRKSLLEKSKIDTYGQDIL